MDKTLIEGPLPEEIIRELVLKSDEHSSGAQAFFLGRVRNDSAENKTVSGIEYSAYPEMVEEVARSIKEELFSEFSDLKNVEILHSTGLVKCGEISLAVMVSSGHRKQAFSAAEKCVERIKESLPVWKKEIFTDGSSRWIHSLPV